MWEVTLSGEICDVLYFEKLKHTLVTEYGSKVVVVINYTNSLVCSIATTDNDNIKSITLNIIETITKCVKNEFIRQNLKIFSNDKNLNTFILSSLIFIDLDEEIDFIYNNSELSKNINIRSFVYFKFKDLVEYWGQLLNYINNNFSAKNSDDIYINFLKFVSDSCTPKEEIIYIKDSVDNMKLLNKDSQIISTIAKKDEIGLLTNLIMYSPKRIVINCNNTLSDKISNLINFIFDDRLCILF